jgi:hypothetical protein
VKAILGKEQRNAGLVLIGIFLLGIYQVFNKESFITLENWGEYVFAPLYFLGPIGGILVTIRNAPLATSWQSKLLWYSVLITSVVYLAVLVYGFYLEPKL